MINCIFCRLYRLDSFKKEFFRPLLRYFRKYVKIFYRGYAYVFIKLSHHRAAGRCAVYPHRGRLSLRQKGHDHRARVEGDDGYRALCRHAVRDGFRLSAGVLV